METLSKLLEFVQLLLKAGPTLSMDMHGWEDKFIAPERSRKVFEAREIIVSGRR